MNRTKLDPVWKYKWVTALRSGEYKQTCGELRDRSGYCVLGVLCDVVDPNGWEAHDTHCYRGHTGWTEPAPSIKKMVNLSPGAIKDLIEMNDFCDYDFVKIANHIEEYL